ncbi:CRISPR-associated endoribonuclease Cas6 [Polycladomyces sp. WAk]|uniref:CRISPR-associated endoribonuclease Cas6 n=1 Tax=Polycladomyces zharkentensis TaxID=2807616 RepID=A0ABS2WN00_9BACL|nr:CRISPR-associated endoribonuclease Cas6 [Polycladomyces sp. WAk]MBN2910821.1 CRISPR-associated endoribonuclease Cas6 [Polycladomyces sp. WAk]
MLSNTFRCPIIYWNDLAYKAILNGPKRSWAICPKTTEYGSRKSTRSRSCGLIRNCPSLLYHHPLTKDFQQQIQRNMLKKYQLVYQSNPITERFDIQPVASFKQRVSFYKEIIIKGYVGKFRLSADDPKLLSLALDTGLGAKGSLGFGCIEQVNVQEGKKAC